MTYETMDPELAKLSPAELELEIARREQVEKDLLGPQYLSPDTQQGQQVELSHFDTIPMLSPPKPKPAGDITSSPPSLRP